MRIRNIAMGNLKRRKGRAFFLVLGLAVAVGTSVALTTLTQALQEEIGKELDRYGANILITPKANSLSLAYGTISLGTASFDARFLQSSDLDALQTIEYRKRLSLIAPKLLGTIKARDGDVVAAGVIFDQESRMKKWWKVVGRLPVSPGEILVGYNMARQNGWVDETGGSQHAAHGMKLDVKEPTFAPVSMELSGKPFAAVGWLRETGGVDDQMVYGHLADIRTLLGKKNELSLIEVSALCNACPVEAMVEQIAAKLPNARVAAIQQSVKSREQTVGQLRRFSGSVGSLVLLIGAMLMTSVMMSSVVERTREIGVLRAVGFRRSHVIKLFLLEAIAVSFVAGITGWGWGILAAKAAMPLFEGGSGASLPFSIAHASLALLASLTLGTAGSVYPAIRAARLSPSETLRHL